MDLDLVNNATLNKIENILHETKKVSFNQPIDIVPQTAAPVVAPIATPVVAPVNDDKVTSSFLNRIYTIGGIPLNIQTIMFCIIVLLIGIGIYSIKQFN